MNIYLTGSAIFAGCMVVGGLVSKIRNTFVSGNKYADLFVYLDMVHDSDAEKFAIIEHIIKNAKRSHDAYITPVTTKTDAKSIVLIQKDFTLSQTHWLERVSYPNGHVAFVVSRYFYKGFLKYNRKTIRNQKQNPKPNRQRNR